MLGGFTFKGIHSSVYGVRETPTNTVLSPRKRRTLIEIPGGSNSIIQEDGGYEASTISLMCSYSPINSIGNYSVIQQVRKIAGWLDGVGELTFDYEPGMHYNAFLSSPPPTVKTLEFAQFSLEFTITHPFAYEHAQLLTFYLSSTANKKVNIFTRGTTKTPVRLIIKNITNQTVKDINITQTYIEI